MTNLKDNLIALAIAPGTHDKDRYARTMRAATSSIVNTISGSDAMDDKVWTHNLISILRSVSRTDSIEANRRRLITALDLIQVALPHQAPWRKPAFVPDPHNPGQTIERTLEMMSGPHFAVELKERGIISTPTECICRTHPHAICFAPSHDVI